MRVIRSGVALRLLPLGVVLLALTLFASPALAADPSLTDDFSAADQYVESVPTSRGPKAPGVGRQAKRAALPAQARRALAGQPRSVAAKLERIVTSPELGAPTSDKKSDRGDDGSRSSLRVTTATAKDDRGGLRWLAFVLLAMTVLALATAAYRRHRGRKTDG